MHNSYAKNFSTNCQKNHCSINNQVTYPFSISNEFIDFLEVIWIFSFFFYVSENFFENFKNERNVTNFGYVFVPRFHITHKNFSGDWTGSFTVITSIFFPKRYFEKRKKKLKKACESGFLYCFLIDFTKFFEEVRCLILASSQRKLRGYIEFLKIDITITKIKKFKFV